MLALLLFMKVVFYSQSIHFSVCTQSFMTNSIWGNAGWKTMTQKFLGMTGDFKTVYRHKYSWSMNCWWADVIVSVVSICPWCLFQNQMLRNVKEQNGAVNNVRDLESASCWDWRVSLLSQSGRNFSFCEKWQSGCMRERFNWWWLFNPAVKDTVSSGLRQKSCKIFSTLFETFFFFSHWGKLTLKQFGLL